MHGEVYDTEDPVDRCEVNLEEYPLTSEDGKEIPVFDSNGKRIQRRTGYIDAEEGACGVLMNLENIQALFTPDVQNHEDDEYTSDGSLSHSFPVSVQAYPLGFLRVAGNIQANGIPHCFYPSVTSINQSVRKAPRQGTAHSDNEGASSTESYRPNHQPAPVVKAISCQFYNYLAHRIAPRAGRLDTQQGTITAALSGAYANTAKDKKTASNKQAYCNAGLPSERFHERINLPDRPTCLRAELVYTIDVRNLKSVSGRHVPTSMAMSTTN